MMGYASPVEINDRVPDNGFYQENSGNELAQGL